MRKATIAVFLSTVLLAAGCTPAEEASETPPAPDSEQTELAPTPEPIEEETPEPAPEPAPEFQLSKLSEDPQMCKIQEDSRMRNPGMANPDYIGQEEIRGRYNGNATAFPFAPTVLPTTGKIIAQMVLVDWEDLPGNQTDYDYYKKSAELTEEFWFMASEGKLEVEVRMTDWFLRIPGSYEDFYMTKEEEGQRYDFRPKKQNLYDAVSEVSDELIDYTDVSVVFPGWPRGKTVSGFGPHEFNFDWNAAFYSEERDIYDITGAGDWHINNEEYFEGPWINYVHEMGHMLGIPHQTHTGELYRDGTYTRKESWWKENPINGFEIMANQDGAIRTLTAWLRWLPGWLDDDQVTCITEDSVEDEIFALSPINEIGGEKEALIIKLSETMVVVVESRRWDERFDRPIVHERDGIIAYTVDATMAAAQGNQALLSPRDITKYLEVTHHRHSEEMDGNFCQGDSVDIANIRITAEHIGDGIDHVRVSKTENYVEPYTPAAGSTESSVNRIDDGCVYGPGADWEYWRTEVYDESFRPANHQIDALTQPMTLARNLRKNLSCSCCGCVAIS